MINYVLYQNKQKESKVYGKWFARAVHQLMEFDEFVEHMAKHHCVYSEGTIRGVLIEMEVCLREMLLEGKSVRFDELGIFSLGITNTPGGATAAADFNISKNIDGVKMNLYLGRRFRARNLYNDATFSEARVYDGGGDAEPSGETAGNGSPSGSDSYEVPFDPNNAPTGGEAPGEGD